MNITMISIIIKTLTVMQSPNEHLEFGMIFATVGILYDIAILFR